MYKHMLIDSKNILYRAIYAGLSDKYEYNYSVIFFRFINVRLQQFKPENVHFMWDRPKDELWRRRVYSMYKEGRKHAAYPGVDIDKIVEDTTATLKELIVGLGCRSFELEKQECDDLIYAFCKARRNEKIVILSSDGDFMQLPYYFDNVTFFNLNRQEVHVNDGIDPVELKCFGGENGDNIPGYTGIGPVKAKVLAEDVKKRAEFLEIHGEDTYRRNRALIDLSLCPYTLGNCIYISKMLAEPAKFDMDKITEVIKNRKVSGLSSEISKILLPFKFLCKNKIGG